MSNAKEQILNAIRQNRPIEVSDYPQKPLFPKSEKPILEEFQENLVIAGGSWQEVEEIEQAEAVIRQLHPEAKVICSATPEVQGNRDLQKVTDPHQLEDVDVGVIRARFGVSENGMVWMTEDDLGVNALGFLSQHLVILLKPDQLVRDMYEAYSRVRLQDHHYGCFMLGPSATADIGAVMVHGAQGARSLTVLFC